jgi:PAS domain-containing protein
MSLTLGIGLFAISVAAALSALALAAFWPGARTAGRGLFAESTGTETVLIFDGETLVDASAGGRALLNAVRTGGPPWQRFLAYARPRFPDVENVLARLSEHGSVTLAARSNDPTTLRAEWRGGLRRIVLSDSRHDTADAPFDSLVRRAQEDELAMLRSMTDSAPMPIWREEDGGDVVWANDAYMALAIRAGVATDDGAWPPPRLFGAPDSRGRVGVFVPGKSTEAWFECEAVDTHAGRVRFALPADAAVGAETALRDFVQTLTLAFAHLPIGLAIFDSQRRLQIFNPALTDLIALPVDFLSARPTLTATLDALRDRRILPEPKDYKAWRQRIMELGDAADPAPLEQTWSLSGDRTYRVIWRPHPRGALALLVEDISDAVTRLRSVRADLALGKSICDALDDAIAVIGPDGTLMQTNPAYAALWGAEAAAEPQRAADLVAAWSMRCAPDPQWPALERALVGAAGGEGRLVHEGTLRHVQGRLLRVRVTTIARGARLVVFTPVQRPELAIAPVVDETRAETPPARPRTPNAAS